MLSIYRYILVLAILTVVPGRRPIAKAQELTGLPACAKPALLAAFQAPGCKATDANCLCSNPNFLTSLQSYIKGACSAADQAAVIAFGQTYCGKQSQTTPTPGSVADVPNASTTSISKIPMPTSSSTPMGGAAETGMSAAALAIAMGGMGWLFAEL